mgnify:CR=1 FL=1
MPLRGRRRALQITSTFLTTQIQLITQTVQPGNYIRLVDWSAMRACAMRKIVTFVGLTLSALLLTSCVKMDISLTVNNDATVSGYTIFAIDKSLAAMSDAASADSSP